MDCDPPLSLRACHASVEFHPKRNAAAAFHTTSASENPHKEKGLRLAQKQSYQYHFLEKGLRLAQKQSYHFLEKGLRLARK